METCRKAEDKPENNRCLDRGIECMVGCGDLHLSHVGQHTQLNGSHDAGYTKAKSIVDPTPRKCKRCACVVKMTPSALHHRPRTRHANQRTKTAQAADGIDLRLRERETRLKRNRQAGCATAAPFVSTPAP